MRPRICMTTAPASIFLPIGSVNSSMHVVGVEVVHGEEQHGRQGQQHDARQAAFAGQRLDLAPDLEALADQVADLVEDFGQVAARLPLQDRRRWRRTSGRGWECGRSCRRRPRPAGCRGSAPRSTRPNSLPIGAAISSATRLKPDGQALPGAQSARRAFPGRRAVARRTACSRRPPPQAAATAAAAIADEHAQRQHECRVQAGSTGTTCPRRAMTAMTPTARTWPASADVSACSNSRVDVAEPGQTSPRAGLASSSSGWARTLRLRAGFLAPAAGVLDAGQQVQAVFDAVGRVAATA